MIWGPCGPSGAFPLITWLFITQFGHDGYQIEAEYVSYRIILFILLLIRNRKRKYQRVQKFSIFAIIFLNWNTQLRLDNTGAWVMEVYPSLLCGLMSENDDLYIKLKLGIFSFI